MRTSIFLSCMCVGMYALLTSTANAQCGVAGKDGSTFAATPNTYYPLPTAYAAAMGTSTIVIDTTLRRGNTATPLVVGDLVLIMQMQGADMVYTPATNASYGNVSNVTAGNYEFNEVVAIAVNSPAMGQRTLTLKKGLLNTYERRANTASKGQMTAQVVRVPQYSALTLTGTLSATPWNGVSGGILALEVQGILDMNGQTISAAEAGFRGGAGRRSTGTSVSNPLLIYTSNTAGTFASKGEGIAGTPSEMYDRFVSETGFQTGSGYPGGDRGRGAPGNAGGGTNTGVRVPTSGPTINIDNPGGGGGGNLLAGGQGGAQATHTGTEISTAGNMGGQGGKALTGNVNKIFMGGGGGAGETNNGTRKGSAASYNNGIASSGGRGGGIVIISASEIIGTGTIDISGGIAGSREGANIYDGVMNDGGGGGGAGGTALISVQSGTLAGLTVNANGGKGGDAIAGEPGAQGMETSGGLFGPGGGGSAGAVYSNLTIGTINRVAGDIGLTGSNLNTFFGSGPGASGVANNATTIPSNVIAGYNCPGGPLCAAPGRDGDVTISVANTVVNAYWPGTVDVTAGTTTLTLGTRRGAATDIAPGDLLIVMQMSGAEINSTNDLNYGNGNSADGLASGYLNNSNLIAGQYEYVVAQGTVTGAGGSLSILGLGAGSGLLYSYKEDASTDPGGRKAYQIIRVPQYNILTIDEVLTCSGWDGSTGGVLAIDVDNTLVPGLSFVGEMNVVGKGFRGGGGIVTGGGGNTDYTRAVGTAGGYKGEGISGTPRYVANWSTGTPVQQDLGADFYPSSNSVGRGAPGNAGGGGNADDAGGGGGGNGGYGGNGGKTWDGFVRGGYGGDKFNQLANSRLVMGGGGGSGHDNGGAGNNSGGAGGGIILAQVNTIDNASGLLTISASGQAGQAQGGNGDGCGGGGAGGSVFFYVRTNPANIADVAYAVVKGGNGGSGTPGVSHGPGGGGGGGVIFSNGAFADQFVNGGAAGTTTAPTGTAAPSVAYYNTAGTGSLTSDPYNLGATIPLRPAADCGVFPFPVEYLSFNASLYGQDCALSWITASELNNERFDIERSVDGFEYQALAEIQGNGNSNTPIRYDYIDADVANLPYPYLYYRLKQTDFDGQFSYSSTLMVALQADGLGFSFFPNPATETVSLTVSALEEGTEIRILDLNGRVIWQQGLSVGSHSLSLDVRTWSKGLYLVEVTDPYRNLVQKLSVQ